MWQYTVNALNNDFLCALLSASMNYLCYHTYKYILYWTGVILYVIMLAVKHRQVYSIKSCSLPKLPMSKYKILFLLMHRLLWFHWCYLENFGHFLHSNCLSVGAGIQKLSAVCTYKSVFTVSSRIWFLYTTTALPITLWI